MTNASLQVWHSSGRSATGVCGISSQAAQKRLLTEPDLTHKAVEVATGMETAVENTRTLQGSTPKDVNKVGQGPRKSLDGAIAAGSQEIGLATAP